MCIDAYVTIRSYVLCVHSLITSLQLKKISVMYESAHDTITFQFPFTSNEFYHNTQPETIWNIRTRYIFKGFLVYGLRSCIMEKISLKLRVNGIVSVTGTHVNVYQIS